MGKKVSQTSVKISKKEKKEFNSLIRLLRPKVYITDCSSFKTLVQDLTGNGSSNISITTSSSHPQQQHRVPVVDVEEYQVEPERSTSVDVSTNASFDSSELWNQEMFIHDQELNQLCYQMYSDDTTTTNILEGSSPSTADQMVDLPFQDLESWLSGIEPFDPFNINGYGQIDQEVSIFDYELSGLL
ncbi:hypothetical protein RchiOBHm_Chr2g0151791 [Rosa chinensis]|uniref:VQ domain-containing protein n=1 Tax=Rosa chinensis TaxID=74649 RepID=A0A2P6S0C2_ROSCH|nr:hypothetical protein RchiOBHm_Chr2g0151791 [Rosa chinensis]